MRLAASVNQLFAVIFVPRAARILRLVSILLSVVMMDSYGYKYMAKIKVFLT